LTYQDVETFFASEREESDKIEFKSFYSAGENDKEKENGIIRTICAFLNSIGGLLIWGAPVGQVVEGKKEKVFLGALSPVNKLVEKDYFVNRITDLVTPSPNNINFYELTDNDKYLYLIEVSQSEYSPHQFRNTYYMRIDGQTKPAPHHYIEALFKKITYPKLKGYITLDKFYDDGRYFFLEITAMIFNLSKLQNEHKAFYRIVVSQGVIFYDAINPRPNSPYLMNGHEFRVLKPADTIYYNQPYRFTELIRLDPKVLQQRNCEFQIWFYFGGEKSPLLLSTYTLRVNFNDLAPVNLNDFLVSLDENRYFFEHSDDLGLTDEQRISEMVGRKL
jgi:hypothetical protein